MPGPQSQNQSASYSPLTNNASHLGPSFDGHLSWPSTYPMDMQSGQAHLLKRNQHMLYSYSNPSSEAWARLRPSPNLPTYLSNTRESCLHSHNSYTDHNQHHPLPRSLTATALPYIPDEHRTPYTNALRRTSFLNLNTKGIHEGQQRTSMDYPLSRPPGCSSSIDESTVKYRDTYMHFDDDQRGYNRYSISHLSPALKLIKYFLVSHSQVAAERLASLYWINYAT